MGVKLTKSKMKKRQVGAEEENKMKQNKFTKFCQMKSKSKLIYF